MSLSYSARSISTTKIEFQQKPVNSASTPKKFSNAKNEALGESMQWSFVSGDQLILMMEVHKKIMVLRDIMDLAPLNSSASLHEMVITTLEDLQRLYPRMIPRNKVSKINDNSIDQSLAYFCEAVESVRESWMTNNDCVDYSNYELPSCKDNSKMRKPGETMLATLDCLINIANDKFDIMEEDDQKKEPSLSYSASIMTPKSVLPESMKYSARARGDSPRSSCTPSLWSLRIQALGKLIPNDLRHLANHMSPPQMRNQNNEKEPTKDVEMDDEKARNPVMDTSDDLIFDLDTTEESDREINDQGKSDKAQEMEEVEVVVSPRPLQPQSSKPSETYTLLQNAPEPLTSSPPLPPTPQNVAMPPPAPEFQQSAIEVTMLSLPPLRLSPGSSLAAAPPPMSLKDGSTSAPTRPMSLKDGSASAPPPPMSLKDGSASAPPPPMSLKDGSASAPPPPMSLKDGSASAPPPPMSLKDGSTSAPPPPMSLKNGSASAPPPPLMPSGNRGAAPPPPPVGAGRYLKPKATTKLKRSTQLGNLYRTLKGKVEGSSPKGMSSGGRTKSIGATSTGGKQGMADALAEMAKRSSYFQQIEEDVQKYTKQIIELRPSITNFKTNEMTKLIKFHRDVESILENLTDESQVLSRFEGFPLKKLEAIRMAAALYRKLDSVLHELQNWNIVSPVSQVLDKAERYFNKIKTELDALERTKDEESKKFKAYNIEFDFLILIKIKESMVDVSSNCMELALKERRNDAAKRDSGSNNSDGKRKECAKLLWRAFQFAFKVYTFAGGHDDRADNLASELAKEIDSDPNHQ
ncbi:hypothetical protein TanjilG_08021 [Lupinus angustifolius]|uniref:Hydroxyproline-rich glycoprotein family protein n=1 Tax=Lupinus angustifolius TaxID=3871 RepID=A0A4P1RM73_LUPAN|nr:PREDICTED: uncharacterized protein At4g04980-like [Lupinus angustifolius]OIW13679.1 hypothetical protein TanjilG_08021 [Lupinus angustifolius]